MANEISVTTNLTATKGNLAFSRSITTNATMNTARKGDVVQNIASGGTAGVALTIPAGVTTNGWVIGRNLDATNFIEVGIQQGGVFYPLVRANAGEPFLFRLAQGITPYARANTAAVDLEYNVLND
jgi:hypothetical protein